jgi:hypothetical protein
MQPIFVLTLGDIIGLVLFVLVVVVALVVVSVQWFNQRMCKHDGGVNETSACDAICRKCGKNLGFIGSWREKHGNE